MIKLEELLPGLRLFKHASIFEGLAYPWEVLQKINNYIKAKFDEFAPVKEGALPKGLNLHYKKTGAGRLAPAMASTSEYIESEEDIILKEFLIFIGSGSKIEPGVLVKAGALVGERSELRQGAYLRGSAVIGEGCTVGHGTEVKNSILLDGAEAGHFAYIGDSVLGNKVNLGAGCKLANLEFRKGEDRRKGIKKSIIITIGDRVLDTGLRKFGAILGDYVEIGCNAVTSPGTIIGPDSWVFPNVTVRKGFYPAMSAIKG